MTIFQGSAVAIVTPFNDDPQKTVNYDKLGEIIEFQLENNTDAIVICGTTGESATMNDEEHLQVIKYAIDKVAKRVPVIAGTGSNDTAHGVRLSVEAEKMGADALLHVTPYYNKTTQKGLKEHFLAMADAVNIPIILYNVPGRTSMNLLPQTVFELSSHPNIVAIKEASGDVAQAIEIRRLCGDTIDIYSGNDDIILPLNVIGAKGVISVLANICPQETHDMCQTYFDGDIQGSQDLQINYKKLIDALFKEANPIPVKEAMNLMGMGVGPVRLPLTSTAESTVAFLKEAMAEMGLL